MAKRGWVRFKVPISTDPGQIQAAVDSVAGIVKLIAGGLIDRHRDGRGRRIAAVAGVQHDGLCMLAGGRHFTPLVFNF
jgi:hypothetical protein